MAISNDLWKTEATKRFPDLVEWFADADTPYLLWFELFDAFQQAYKNPRNQDLIRRIYAFAAWCESQPPGSTAADDLRTCVTVCFTEHIPTIPEALDDMPRWFTREEVERMKEVFIYQVGESGYTEIVARFDRSR